MIFATREKEVLLPTNVPALDAFVDDVQKTFNLPEGDDTYEMIATMIMHLPMKQAYATKSFFGHGVLKSMANQAAFKKLTEFREKRDAEEKLKKESEALEASNVIKLADTQPSGAHADVKPV